MDNLNLFEELHKIDGEWSPEINRIIRSKNLLRMKQKLDDYFKDWTPKTKCIVVGSSPSLGWYDFGKYIDSHEIVIRVNRCFSYGTRSNTGRKINIWATTNNDRWIDSKGRSWPKDLDATLYNPIRKHTEELWLRTPKTEAQMRANGTLSLDDDRNQKGYQNYLPSGQMVKIQWLRGKKKRLSTGNNNLLDGIRGIGTGLLTLDKAIYHFGEITTIGNTFYLESEDGKCYGMGQDSEDEEHEKNRLKILGGNRWGMKSMAWIKRWHDEGKLDLLNPFEYDNLRCKTAWK